MGKKATILKASGEKELFDPEKLKISLRRAGADDDTIAVIVKNIMSWMYEGVSTRKIYARAFSLLRKKKGSFAARYNLKNAIMELGPTGYPFERFIGQIFRQQGYDIEVGIVVEGNCVMHEVDVIATRGKEQNLMECKFYNNQGKFANVQVPLYIRSRVDDIVKRRQGEKDYEGFSFQGWIVTNTRFTTDALAFGKCSGLKLLSWDFPQGNSLIDMIEKDRVFPVTTLSNISKNQKEKLIASDIVLCRQILDNPAVIDRIGLNRSKKLRLLDEVASLHNH